MAKKKQPDGKYRFVVPADCAAESAAIGNFSAELVPGSVIHTDSREFAEYLTANFGAEEVQAGQPPEADGGN